MIYTDETKSKRREVVSQAKVGESKQEGKIENDVGTSEEKVE